jgi:peptidoglycan/LPS O-acetylase OafA/YrhL
MANNEVGVMPQLEVPREDGCRGNFAEVGIAEVGTRSVPTASDIHIRELDGIRAIAICFVVFAHYRLLPYVPGGFGVTLFFFLSGYLITTLFYSEYRSTLNINIPRFYLRRWLRLTPPLVIFVVLATLFCRFSRNAVGGDAVPTGTIMAALLYYTNYYDLSWGMNPDKVIPLGICWSLAIEEHFYLAWPWILRRNIQNSQKLFLLIVTLCASALIWRIAARHFLSVSNDYTYMATDCRIDSILYGAMLRVLFETPWAPAVVRVLRARMCRILALILLLATFLFRDDNFRETFRYTIQGLALMPLFTAVLSDDPNTLIRRTLSSPPMVLIGRLSYSIYLLHLLGRTPEEVLQIDSPIIGLSLTGAAAYIIFIFVERPIAGLRRRFRAKGRSSSSVTTIAPLTQAPTTHSAPRPTMTDDVQSLSHS